jgi:hypothetical protein
VGERNHRWFLLYLLSNTALLLYGAAACVSVLASEIVGNQLFKATFVKHGTEERVPAGWGIVAQYLLYTHMPVVMVLLLCVVMGAVLTGFSAYHVYLVAINVTTNETFKWQDAQWHHDGAMAKYEAAKAKHAALQAATAALAGGDGGTAAATGEAGAAGGELRLDPPPHVRACLEGRCDHADHAQYAGRTVSAWVLRQPPPMPAASAYNRGWRANFAECVFPFALYGRPRGPAGEPAVAPLEEFAGGRRRPVVAKAASGGVGGSGSGAAGGTKGGKPKNR